MGDGSLVVGFGKFWIDLEGFVEVKDGMLVIAAADERSDEPVDLAPIEAQVAARLAEGATVKTVVSELSEDTALPRRELYALVQRLREAADV